MSAPLPPRLPAHLTVVQGNTAVYLLYAHARIAAIIRKAGKDPAALAAAGARISLAHDKELALAKHIAQFPGGWVGGLVHWWRDWCMGCERVVT